MSAAGRIATLAWVACQGLPSHAQATEPKPAALGVYQASVPKPAAPGVYHGAEPKPAALGVYQGAGCDGVERLQTFVAWFGRKPDRVVEFFSVDSWASMRIAAHWAVGCWAKTPYAMTFSLPMLPRGVRDTNGDVAQGRFDDHFRSIGADLVQQGYARATVRIGWEMNAGWFPWSSLQEPQAYVGAWRRIVATLRGVPGAAFRFEWAPALGPGAASPEPAYPGDDVVDLIGGDVYNTQWGAPLTATQRWQALLDAPFGLAWHRRFAAAHGKPMSYPEWGTGTRPDGHGAGDDALFIREMARWIRANPVDYHAYWDYPAPDYNAQLSDGHQPAAGQAFLEAFK